MGRERTEQSAIAVRSAAAATVVWLHRSPRRQCAGEEQEPDGPELAERLQEERVSVLDEVRERRMPRPPGFERPCAAAVEGRAAELVECRCPELPASAAAAAQEVAARRRRRRLGRQPREVRERSSLARHADDRDRDDRHRADAL
jgi:hypothetical protein